jgi:hypothetical protein
MLRNPELILELQSLVGASLWQCQALEETLIHCLLVGNRFDRNEKLNVVEQLLKKHGELTLGQLARQIETLPDVSSELKEKLKLLKVERNWLVHRSWSDSFTHANSFPPTELENYLKRVHEIHDEALKINKLFSRVLEERVRRAGVSGDYLDKKTKEIYSRWLAG